MSDINFVSKKTMIFIDEKTFCKIGALNFQKLLPKKKKDPACKERGLLNLKNLKNLKTIMKLSFKCKIYIYKRQCPIKYLRHLHYI